MLSLRLALLASALVAFTPFVSAAESPLLGSPDYKPSPESPTGWRGDGTGRYPAATPPITWSRSKTGESRNIVWAAPLPAISVASPIIVGDKIFVMGEVYDLICLDKKSGRMLWIRSSPEFEGLDEAARSAPAYSEILAPLVVQLSKANAEVVETFNAQFLGGKPGAAGPALANKREIEKKIQAAEIAIDPKAYARDWRQAVFGFAGQTPASDGKHVCAFFTNGISVCYDLDGTRKWTHRGSGFASEHGNFASPIICGNRLAVWAYEMRGYDIETGKQIWSFPAWGNNTYGSMFKFKCGNDLIAAHQCGYFVRVADGKKLFVDMAFGDSVATPIVENGIIFADLGYPATQRISNYAGLKAFKIPAAETGQITLAYPFSMDFTDTEIPVSKEHPFDRSILASPLLVDGLLYRMTECGGLIVNDAATGQTVYRKLLPMSAITQYWTWAGAATSPTLAGKFIYLMDNQGTTVVIEPGRQYKEVARNLIDETWDGKNRVQNLSTPVFEGTRMYYRSPTFLYCIEGKPLPVLLTSLKADAAARADACKEIAALGAAAKEALPALKDCLSFNDPMVQVNAAAAIQQIDPNDKTAVKFLRDLYRKESSDVVRKQITSVLETLNLVPAVVLEYSGRESDAFAFHSNTALASKSAENAETYKIEGAHITKAALSADHRTVTLTIPGLSYKKPVTLSYSGLVSADNIQALDPVTFTPVLSLFLNYKFADAAGNVVRNTTEVELNGELKGGATITEGRKGRALNLTHDQWLEVANTPEFERVTAGNYTITFWIKLKAAASGSWRSLVHKGAIDIERCPGLFLNPNDEGVHFRISAGPETDQGGTSSTPLKLGQWMHVAFVRDHAVLRLYVDGKKTEASAAQEFKPSSGPLYIGKDPWYHGADCEIEDFRVYSKALNDSDVEALTKQ